MRDRLAITAAIAMIGTACFGPNSIDQDRHQHDRGAGADDARQGAGDKADREDENEIQGGVSGESGDVSPSAGRRVAR